MATPTIMHGGGGVAQADDVSDNEHTPSLSALSVRSNAGPSPLLVSDTDCGLIVILSVHNVGTERYRLDPYVGCVMW